LTHITKLEKGLTIVTFPIVSASQRVSSSSFYQIVGLGMKNGGAKNKERPMLIALECVFLVALSLCH